MSAIIKKYNFEAVDEGVLTSTGKGGVVSNGYLRDEPLQSYLGPEENAVFVAQNRKSGVSYEKRAVDDSGRFQPGEGYRAFALATDSRLLIIIGDNRSGSGENDRSVVVPFADIDLVNWESRLLKSTLSVTTAADVRWTFPVRGGDVERFGTYLETAADAWGGLEQRLNRARGHVLDASQHITDHEYEAAMAAVREAMAETDAAKHRERTFCEAGVPAMRERIDRVEERIRDLRLRVLRGRAAHHIDEAEQHWRDECYDAAYDAYEAAHDDYAEALATRGGDFADTEPLRDKLARVERNIAYLEGAPLQRAEDAREAASGVDDPQRRAELLQTALERYQTTLELDWGRDLKRFEGDTEQIRERVVAVVTDLVATRVELATGRRRRGDRHLEAGRYERAGREYRSARSHLEAAADTAAEFAPRTSHDLQTHLDALEERFARLEQESTATQTDDTDALREEIRESREE